MSQRLGGGLGALGGVRSSLGHVCIAIPQSIDALADRIAENSEATGLRCDRLRSPEKLPVW